MLSKKFSKFSKKLALKKAMYLSIVVNLFLINVFFISSFAQAADGDDVEVPSVSNAESDLLRLESRFIGDKEQPLVSYIVPWQGTGSPDDLKWKIERKNDDTLSLVDRDIMLRSMNIYNEMGLEQIEK